MFEKNGGLPVRWMTLAAVIAVVAALYLAETLLVPFALAVFLSLLLAPLVDRLERWRVPRVPAAAGVVLLALTLAGWLGWVVLGQLSDLSRQLPVYRGTLATKAASVGGPAGRALGKVYDAIHEVQGAAAAAFPRAREAAAPDVARVEVVDSPVRASRIVTGALGTLLRAAGMAGIVIFLVPFFLVFRADIRDRLIRLVGDHQVDTTTHAIDEISNSVSRYLLAQACINAAYGLALAGGLHLVGLPNAALWGVLGGLLRFVPYAGLWISAGLPLFLSLAVFDSWTPTLVIAGYIGALELMLNNLLEPWVYGCRTGLSPLAVVVCAVFWAWLWGPAGLLLSVPLTVCLFVLGKHVPPLEFLAILLGREPVPELERSGFPPRPILARRERPPSEDAAA